MFHVETILDALQESPARSVHAQAIKIREVLPTMNTALRMAGVDKVFVGLNQLTGATLVDSFNDGTRSIQNMLTERNFMGIPTGFSNTASPGLIRECGASPGILTARDPILKGLWKGGPG